MSAVSAIERSKVEPAPPQAKAIVPDGPTVIEVLSDKPKSEASPRTVLAEERLAKQMDRYMNVITEIENDETRGPQHPDLIVVNNVAGVSLLKAGEYSRALPYFERTVQLAELADATYGKLASIACNNAALIHQKKGNLSVARQYQEKCVATRVSMYGDNNPDTAVARVNLAAIIKAMGDLVGAAGELEKARDCLVAHYGGQHLQVAHAEHHLAMVYYSIGGKLQQCCDLWKHSLQVREQLLPADHTEVARALNNYAIALAGAGEGERALPLLERALSIWQSKDGEGSFEMIGVLTNMIPILQATPDRRNEVPDLQRQIREIRKKHTDSPGLDSYNLVRIVMVTQRLLKRVRHRNSLPGSPADLGPCANFPIPRSLDTKLELQNGFDQLNLGEGDAARSETEEDMAFLSDTSGTLECHTRSGLPREFGEMVPI